MLTCEKTGRPTITKEFAEYLATHREIPKEYFTVGDEAHRAETVTTRGKIAHWSRTEEQS